MTEQGKRQAGQKRGGRFFAQPVDPVTGRRMSVTAGSQAELDSRLRRIRDVKDGLRFSDITIREAAGKLRPAVGVKLTVDDVWERYLPGVPEASTDIAGTAWKQLLAPQLAGLSIYDLTETRMRNWRRWCERARTRRRTGYAPRTIRGAYQFLRAAVALAMRDGLLSEWPWGGFTVPNPKDPETERDSLRDFGELVRLLEAAAEYDEKRKGRAGDGCRLPILFLSLTGLRQAEAAGLAWTDLELERSPPLLHVRRQAKASWRRRPGAGDRPEKTPKTGKRDQVLHADVARELLAHRQHLIREGRFDPQGPVFPPPRSKAFRTSGILLMPSTLRRVVVLAGFPESGDVWVTHSLRHSQARLELLATGGDITAVKSRTGHKDTNVLIGYLRKMARTDGGSRLPELPAHVGPRALVVGAPLLEAPAALRANLNLDAYRGPPRALGSRKGKAVVRGAVNWADLAAAWVTDERGEAAPLPEQVRAEIRATYQKAYQITRKREGSKEDARAAGKRAARASRGAWGKVVAAARSKLPAPF